MQNFRFVCRSRSPLRPTRAHSGSFGLTRTHSDSLGFTPRPLECFWGPRENSRASSLPVRCILAATGSNLQYPTSNFHQPILSISNLFWPPKQTLFLRQNMNYDFRFSLPFTSIRVNWNFAPQKDRWQSEKSPSITLISHLLPLLLLLLLLENRHPGKSLPGWPSSTRKSLFQLERLCVTCRVPREASEIFWARRLVAPQKRLPILLFQHSEEREAITTNKSIES